MAFLLHSTVQCISTQNWMDKLFYSCSVYKHVHSISRKSTVYNKTIEHFFMQGGPKINFLWTICIFGNFFFNFQDCLLNYFFKKSSQYSNIVLRGFYAISKQIPQSNLWPIKIVRIVTIFFWKWVQPQRLQSHDLLLCTSVRTFFTS